MLQANYDSIWLCSILHICISKYSILVSLTTRKLFFFDVCELSKKAICTQRVNVVARVKNLHIWWCNVCAHDQTFRRLWCSKWVLIKLLTSQKRKMLESTQAIQVSRATDKGSHCVIELPLRSAVSVYGFASRTEGKQKRRTQGCVVVGGVDWRKKLCALFWYYVCWYYARNYRFMISL